MPMPNVIRHQMALKPIIAPMLGIVNRPNTPIAHAIMPEKTLMPLLGL